MFNKLFRRGQALISAPQQSILSAAIVIMLMIVLSQILGVVRQRVLLHFFSPADYALFLAAFRLPDLVFEVFAFGAFSSAFVPVFSKSLNKGEDKAWDVASRVINIGLLIFIGFAIVFGLLAPQFYSIVAPGFDVQQTQKIVSLARLLFAAQGFFIVSYVITGVLESLKRFLVPALAPLFYNLGIIAGTIILAPSLGLFAPAAGVVIGAFSHLLIQYPLARKLGFRFSTNIEPTEDVKKIGKLAAPRFLELSVLQVLKTAELFFASLISTASYTYLNLANSLQTVPISLFGVSLSKAAMITLSHQEDDDDFKKTFLSTLYQMMFFVVPASVFIAVLRIPIVRLIFGTNIFDWEATVQTGLVLSAFALGIPFQAALALLSRAFYARHNTRVPVIMSIVDVVLTVVLEIIFVLVFKLPVWSIAMANSLAAMVQVSGLYLMLGKHLNHGGLFSLAPIRKIVTAAAVSGTSMFFLLKFFDRSVWVKRLSFLSGAGGEDAILFRSFVLDTRYTFNLFILTIAVCLIGAFLYLGLLFLMRSRELMTFVDTLKKGKMKLAPARNGEPITQGGNTENS